MRIKGWHLIGLAAVVFLLDFFTLGNRNVIDNQIADIIAFIIGLICVLVFLFGIIKTLCALFSKNTGTEKVKREQEHEQGNRATGVEIGFRRILAGLLIISIVPANVLFPIIGLIITLPFLLLALYLLFNRQYHLIFNCFLVLPGCLYYFVNFNILPLLSNQSYFSFNKIIELSACPGLIDPRTTLLTQIIFNSIPQYLFFTASLFLLAANIIARLKLAHKARLNVVALFIICLVLLFLPFLYVPQVALGDAMSGGTGGQPLSFFVTNKSFHMSYDQALNTYIYTANMLNQDSNNFAAITNICVDTKLVPIKKENNMLQVENGVIAGGEISVAPGQTVTIKLVSQEPFYVITLFEGMGAYKNSWLK